ncbi:hypothetical protein ACFWIB_42040 [Streptomyces sp. NPDC127051]|uniref:hypothetical protein n=1 Tax=Streptomyces sp. NPDC127051 TaxID=3347119 RepID=UPI003652A701
MTKLLEALYVASPAILAWDAKARRPELTDLPKPQPPVDASSPTSQKQHQNAGPIQG